MVKDREVDVTAAYVESASIAAVIVHVPRATKVTNPLEESTEQMPLVLDE
jgi:hypothetical protein